MGGHVLAFFQGDDEQGTGTEIANSIKNDSKTLTVTSTILPSAGTDGEDMVTAWARAELAYRTQLAESPGTAPAATKAEIAIPRQEAVVTAAQQTPIAAAAPKTGGNPVVSVDQLFAVYDVAPKEPAATPNLWKASLPSSHQTSTKAANAAYQNAAGSIPTPALSKVAAVSANSSGSVASDGGWFTAAMFDALARYDVRTETDDDAPAKKINLVN